jgi:hypothetical protein
VLFLGNFLNEGTFRGASYGFKLQALLRVRIDHLFQRYIQQLFWIFSYSLRRVRCCVCLLLMNSLQLAETRASDGRTTLLHYLARLTTDKHQHLAEFIEDLTHSALAARGAPEQTLTVKIEFNLGYLQLTFLIHITIIYY